MGQREFRRCRVKPSFFEILQEKQKNYSIFICFFHHFTNIVKEVANE